MSNLPYVTATGNISKVLEAIKKAPVPDKVSGDYVKTILGIKGGSGDQINSYLKKIGFVEASGVPTKLYTKFRNPTTSGSSVAEAMKAAYKPLFDRNQHAYALSEDELKGLIIEETGQPHDSNPVKMMFGSFKALNTYADFEQQAELVDVTPQTGTEESFSAPPRFQQNETNAPSGAKLNIGYNIHLNLPATNDISVFNAIFKSLRENLLVNDD